MPSAECRLKRKYKPQRGKYIYNTIIIIIVLLVLLLIVLPPPCGILLYIIPFPFALISLFGFYLILQSAVLHLD